MADLRAAARLASHAMLLVFALALSGAAAATNLKMHREAVFKIIVTSSEPVFSSPWKKAEPSGSNGTGFYIGQGRIMTNAHVVANATYVAVLRDGDSKPVPAFVRFVAHDSDLAILELQDPTLLAKVRPMRFGGLPRLRSEVATIGFPTGGEQISVTQGVVSRISYRRYVHHGSASHLLVQVDSAINPGNSGGPVVQGRFVVGVAFQSLTRADNTGYIIPVPVIERFLKDVEDGTYDGHPEDGLTTMDWALLNPSTAAYHGMAPDEGGTKLAHVQPWSSSHGLLEPGDILVAVDGRPIGVDGKVDFQGERVDFRTVFDLKQMGEVATYRVVRDGRRFDVPVPVKRSRLHHAPELVYARHPRYVVWGGLVFTALSRSYLRSWGDRWWRESPLVLRFFDVFAGFEPETAANEDLPVLVKRLPDAVNAYATGNLNRIVREVDGHEVRSVADLGRRLDEGTGEFAVIRFHGSNEPLVLARAAVKARNEAINKKYGVHPDRWLHGPEVDGAIGAPAPAAVTGGL